jgi:predicted PurR-regulated permease PerM
MERSPGEQQPPLEAPATTRTRHLSTNVFLLASLVLVAWVLSPLWKPLLLGTVFGGAVTALHDRLAARLWHRRYLSAALFTVAAWVLILAPLATLGAVAVRQALAAVNWVREALSSGGLREILRPLPDTIERWLQAWLPRKLPANPAEAGRWAALQMQTVVATLSEFTIELTMMMITFFFVLADGRKLVGWLTSVSPLGRARTQELLDEFRLVARSVIGSNLLTGVAQASVATIGYVVARTPQPLFFGLVTLLASFIPSVGTAIVSLPLAALLLLTGHLWAGLFLVGWSLLVVAMVDNVMRPWLIKGNVQVHGAIVFFSIIGGIMLFGFSGLVVGPMALSFFLTMMRFHARDLGQPAAAPPPLPQPAPEGAPVARGPAPVER